MDGKKFVDQLWEIADLEGRPFDSPFNGKGIKVRLSTANVIGTVAKLAAHSKELAKVLQGNKVTFETVNHLETLIYFEGIDWPDDFDGYGDEPFDDDDESDEEDDDDEV